MCNRSLARACHSARRKRSVMIASLCGSGKSSSKTGMAHCAYGLSTGEEKRSKMKRTHLQQILVIAGSQFPHLRGVAAESPDGTTAKGRDQTKPMFVVNSIPGRANF